MLYVWYHIPAPDWVNIIFTHHHGASWYHDLTFSSVVFCFYGNIVEVRRRQRW